jgi:hypothetical protein
MINFRFHLVSLTAVFLALGIGIAVGASVVDRATVDLLEDRLKGVENRLDATDTENAELRRQLGDWATFTDQARDQAVAGRLDGVPVLVVGVQGIDRGPVEAFRQTLTAANANLLGTVWFTSKLRLEKDEDAVALADLLGVAPRSADVVRRNLVSLLVSELSGQTATALLARLRDAAFVEYEAPAGVPVDLATLPADSTRFVIVSDGRAEVPNEQLAVPFATQLAEGARARVLAVEAGEDVAGTPLPEHRGVFVGALRTGPAAPLLSSVDNLEDWRGRFSAVYALRDLGSAKVGHYGAGPGAVRLVPETAG